MTSNPYDTPITFRYILYQENLSGMTGKINSEYKSTPDSKRIWDFFQSGKNP